MVHVMSFPMINALFFYVRRFIGICAVTNIAVSCSSLMLCLPGMLFRYFLNDFEVVLFAPVITAIPFVFTLYICCISIVRSLYFKILSVPFMSTYYYYYYYYYIK